MSNSPLMSAESSYKPTSLINITLSLSPAIIVISPTWIAIKNLGLLSANKEVAKV